jgi:hypothetical protein
MYKGLIKFSSTEDWRWDVEPVQLIRNTNTLTKAGADNSELRTEKTAGQTDALVIALGAYEGTGANRNGDIFKEAECLKHYKTFIKSGSKAKDGSYDGRALNRHHKNKPTDPKYGNIKAAAYNNKMKRIELVIGMDNDKCAEEIQKLADGKQINVSMAAKVAYDKCTWCGHEAKDDNSRCKDIPVKLGEVNKRGEMCSMENIDPKWFELSIVGRPADRIGMSLKLASDSNYIKTASDYKTIYPGFVAPDDDEFTHEENFLRISKHAAEKRNLVKKLAAMEKHIDGVIKAGPKDSKDKYLVEQKSKINHGDAIPEETMDELRKYEPSKLLRALADQGIVFSPEDFMHYLFGAKGLGNSSDMFSKVKSHLPSVFSDIDEDGDKEINEDKYEPSSHDMIPKHILDTVKNLFEDHSLFDKPVHGRIMKITIVKRLPSAKLHGNSNKEDLSKEASVKLLARQYASYKLAAMRYLDSQDKLDDELIFNALVQNR